MKVVHKENGEVEVSKIDDDGHYRVTAVYKHPLEALIEECKLWAGFVCPRRTRFNLFPKQMQLETNISSSQITRVIRGASMGSGNQYKIAEIWLFRLHIWSGMPVENLFELAGIPMSAQPHRPLHSIQRAGISQDD